MKTSVTVRLELEGKADSIAQQEAVLQELRRTIGKTAAYTASGTPIVLVTVEANPDR